MQIEFRNPVENPDGTIDCEVRHPAIGWVPFTASKDDPALHGRKIHAAALEMVSNNSETENG